MMHDLACRGTMPWTPDTHTPANSLRSCTTARIQYQYNIISSNVGEKRKEKKTHERKAVDRQ